MTADRFDALRQPLTVGAIDVPNRLWMAPLTRNRADADGTPNALMARYYVQRASAGLIVSEATWVVQQGKPYPRTPGLATDAHRDGWRAVTDAVHAAGGRIVAQLWHSGRVSHPETTGQELVSASATPFERLTIFTDTQAKATIPTPRALRLDELPGIVAGYVDGARRAIDAGFDGVEVHGANGYLLEQFLADGINHRDDAYGGTPENRARLVVEVVEAVAAAVGADRTGLRISPGHGAHETVESDGGDTHRALADALAPLGLAYVHALSELDRPLIAELRERYGAPFVLNSGFAVRTDRDEAISIVADDRADAVAVGRAWIGNPDLLERWGSGAPVTDANSKLFYSDGPEGYVDYPTLAEEQAAEERAA
ncbi:NADH:flavin oxidoreductase/NADH oxidase [Patulibacter medicamentivorans]|uniref:NADH:flavin oxidoreductase/NADH oxidase n=1 Tax=Patulibacter medicamentivorans TaxID=1097667 RepID=H0E4L8_9ACTN|nr:alkene reductase [Patulibacter medicamentivorans]EHN11389.1 NADH:flavin oxidoreductase/NADH oxidase [Patulibacter medicamentivorans]